MKSYKNTPKKFFKHTILNYIHLQLIFLKYLYYYYIIKDNIPIHNKL